MVGLSSGATSLSLRPSLELSWKTLDAEQPLLPPTGAASPLRATWSCWESRRLAQHTLHDLGKCARARRNLPPRLARERRGSVLDSRLGLPRAPTDELQLFFWLLHTMSTVSCSHAAETLLARSSLKTRAHVPAASSRLSAPAPDRSHQRLVGICRRS